MESFEQSDDKLIAHFWQGDREAVGKLIEKYQRPLYFLCLRMIGDHNDALELVQKTFFKVLEKLDTLQNPAAFKTWVYKIALNLCYNLRRERASYSKVLNTLSVGHPITYFHDPLEQEEQKNIIRDSLQNLSEKQKSAVILRIYHDLSYLEIGKILGCRETTARSHFHLGVKKLAGKLKDFLNEDFHEVS